MLLILYAQTKYLIAMGISYPSGGSHGQNLFFALLKQNLFRVGSYL